MDKYKEIQGNSKRSLVGASKELNQRVQELRKIAELSDVLVSKFERNEGALKENTKSDSGIEAVL